VAFWASTDSVTTSYTTPTAVLLLLGSFLILPLSVTEHYKAIKPSTLLSSYLALCLLLDVVRTRTLWLSTPNQTTTQIYSASVAVRLVLLISESCSKSQILNEKHLQPSPEESSGIFGRSLFAWLYPLLFKGFMHKLSMGHLFPLSSEMSASHLSARFGSAWESSKCSYARMVRFFFFTHS
jgi:ATP-binding cassette subfamily C (CFTR/MRP) protein 1